MVDGIREIKIFVSSPNDVARERDICKKIIGQMDSLLSKQYRVKLNAYFWETDEGSVGMGNPQSRTPNPAKYDLYIGILWEKFGSPTGEVDPNTGVESVSGTKYEFDQAYDAWKKKRKPEIKFLRKHSVKDKKYDDEQYRLVEEFFKEFSSKCQHEGIYSTFEDDEGFEKTIREIIFNYVVNTDRMTRLSGHYVNAGVSHLFLYGDNDERNIVKKADIADTEEIRLMAHSGYSYLHSPAERFYKGVEGCLEREGRVKILLTNPYSESGHYVSVGNVKRKFTKETLFERFKRLYSENTPEGLIECSDNARWVQHKLKPALEGYLELKEEYGDAIELRMCPYEMNATVLLVDDAGYIEPYFHCVGAEEGMNAFEVRVKKSYSGGKDNFFLELSEYFDFLWELSEEYEEYLSNCETHKEELRKTIAKRKA